MVKKNQGAAGVDEVSIKEFEINLKDNLYKLWNRMSSGCYFPPPVKGVEIPKKDGKKRLLGIPTVADRIAQMIVKIHLEPKIEPEFHKDSYGYRPNKGAIDALKTTRKRCWKYDWAIDMDIKGFFDNMEHELVMKALKQHTENKWIILYVERWLKAPIQIQGNKPQKRERGTPQGGVISPLLANLFLHYALDKWMDRNYPRNPFERYADDIVIHCKTEAEAEALLKEISSRLNECGLEVHTGKTKIVYCKDSNRPENGPEESFDFLGYTFRARSSRNYKGALFMNFTPAISDKAKKRIKKEIKGWHLSRLTGRSLKNVASLINPQVRGWIEYYGKYHQSAIYPIFCFYMEEKILKWAKRKYKKLKESIVRAKKWLDKIRKREPSLFAHWKLYGSNG